MAPRLPPYLLNNFRVSHTRPRGFTFSVDYIFNSDIKNIAFSVQVIGDDGEVPICNGSPKLSTTGSTGTAIFIAEVCPNATVPAIISDTVVVNMFDGADHVLSQIFSWSRIWIPVS